MSRRAVVNTAAATYVQIASTVLAGFLSVSVALKFLDTDRMGLWSFALQSLGYLLLLDFGVSNSMARLMGEPFHSSDPKEAGRWVGLLLLVSSAQGLIFFLAGWFSVDWVLDFFKDKTPVALRPEARALWLWLVALNALNFPSRIIPAILFAQNRTYWTLLAGSAGTWAGLLAFLLFLRAGMSTLAYAYSTALTTLVTCALMLWAVKCGPNRIKFSLDGVNWKNVKQLFHFSTGLLIIGLTTQVTFGSQAIILTKMLGFSAVTLFTVSSRAGMLGLQVLWRTFDVLNPRWQQLYVAGDRTSLAGSFKRYTGLAISLALLGGTLVIILNHPFINLLNHWGKREGVYAGATFDALLALFIVQHTWTHCLAFLPVLAKDLQRWVWFGVLDMTLNISLSIIFVKWVGVAGMLAGCLIGSSVGMILLGRLAPRYLSLTPGELLKPSLRRWLAMAVCGAAAFACFRFTDLNGNNLWLRGLFCVLTLGLFLVLHRDDLAEFLSRGRRFKL